MIGMNECVHVEKATDRGYLFVKRLFDVVASLMAGIVLCIPMALIVLIIRLDSGGPAIFKQERLGKDGKPFTMYKFRSMCQDAEVNGPVWADKDDSRCTRVGRVLRKSRLDELPQLWNILRGDMSIVGPRPERACFYDQFETYIPGFRERLQVRPGLTGLAQINGRDHVKSEEKVRLDTEYLQRFGFMTDLSVLLRTIPKVIDSEGVRLDDWEPEKGEEQ